MDTIDIIDDNLREELLDVLEEFINKTRLLIADTTPFNDYYNHKNIAKDLAAVKIGGTDRGDITVKDIKDIQAALVANPKALDQLVQKNCPDIIAKTTPDIDSLTNDELADIFNTYYEVKPIALGNEYIIKHDKKTDIMRKLEKLKTTTRLILSYNVNREYPIDGELSKYLDGGELSRYIDTHNTLDSIGIKPIGRRRFPIINDDKIEVYSSDICADSIIYIALIMQYRRYIKYIVTGQQMGAMGANRRDKNAPMTDRQLMNATNEARKIINNGGGNIDNLSLDEQAQLRIKQEENPTSSLQNYNPIEEALDNNELAKFINEGILRPIVTLSSLTQHYKPNQIPKSIPITEYAKYNPKYQRELLRDGELSTQSRDEIITDLKRLKGVSFTFMNTDQETGKKTTNTIWPLDYSIEQEGQQYTIKYLALSPSYRQYLNEHHGAIMVPTPPSIQLLKRAPARNLAYTICILCTERANINDTKAGKWMTLPLQQTVIDIYGTTSNRSIRSRYKNIYLPQALKDIKETCPEVIKDYRINAAEDTISILPNADTWRRAVRTPEEREAEQAETASKKANLKKLIEGIKKKEGQTKITPYVLECVTHDLEITKEELEGYINKPETIPDEIAERIETQNDGRKKRENMILKSEQANGLNSNKI